MAESLRHNASNPVTAAIERLDAQAAGLIDHRGTVVRKVISASRPTQHIDWTASDDPTHWLYWRREADFYTSAIPEQLVGTGLRAPRLLDSRVLPGGDVELLLEDVAGPSGAELSIADLERACHALGVAQARWHRDPPSVPWASRGAIRDHCASKHVDPRLLDDDDAWNHPLIRSAWPDELRPGVQRLHDRRDALFTILEQAPRTFAHLDFWAHNLIATPDAIVALDWAFAGYGALGEDPANLVAEAGLDQLVPVETLPSLSDRVLTAYLRGLDAGGFTGSHAAVRRAFAAAAVKFHWMAALHLHQAQIGVHHVYGGDDDPDPEAQVRDRGRTLAFLVANADAALSSP
jgi:hypothetical protein